MTFRIVYVEDDKATTKRVQEALKNRRWSGEDLQLVPVEHPDQLAAALSPEVDLVLADIGFPDAEGQDQNLVAQILDTAEQTSALWPGDAELDRPTLPVIVYTARSADLRMLLDIRRRLYDIWDKSVATPEYVAWRLGTVARELERARPGRVLQKMVDALPDGPSWRGGVEGMLRKYSSGWSELDQIARCGDSVSAISSELGCDEGRDMWDVIEQWELIDRAADHRVRGHARHALHVFWLGYVLINLSELATAWETAWQTLLDKRPNRDDVKSVAWREAINAMWFFTAVFHDVGYAAQDAASVVTAIEHVSNLFDTKWLEPKNAKPGRYLERVEDVFASLRTTSLGSYQTLAEKMEAHWKGSSKNKTPDHGCASAGRLLGANSKDKKCSWWLREAARAVALHSAFPKVDVPALIDFENDPIACLLLLLDQLQTWDRERPEKLAERDWPERAELVDLTIDTTQSINLKVRYIVRRHVEHNAIVFARVDEALTKVLQRLPIAVMRELRAKLPFHIHVDFLLSEKLLDTVAAQVRG